jgi:hypothetical protein
VGIIHEAVRGSAESMAKLSGVPDYPFVVAGYPYGPTGVWNDEEIGTLAAQVVPAVRALLTRGT